MKSIIFKVLFIAVFTFLATANLYPAFEGWDYEYDIFLFVLLASIALFALTETTRYFHRISFNKKLITYSLVFYVAALLISIYVLSTSYMRYFDNKKKFTRPYPPKPLNKEIKQYPIVISNKINLDNPDIDSFYQNNILQWIYDFGGERKKAFELTSLTENENEIYKSFTMFLWFSLAIFFSIYEIRFYGKKWERAKILAKNSDAKETENVESIKSLYNIQSGEITAKLNKARQLVAQKSPHFQNQIIGLKNRLTRTKRQFNQNTLEDEKISTSRSRIDSAVLELIDEIELELKK